MLSRYARGLYIIRAGLGDSSCVGDNYPASNNLSCTDVAQMGSGIGYYREDTKRSLTLNTANSYTQ